MRATIYCRWTPRVAPREGATTSLRMSKSALFIYPASYLRAEHEAHLHRWRPPQFIKCAPLSRELRKEHGKVMVHTGQDAHRNWKGAFKRRTWYGACVRRDKLNANRRAGSIQPCIKAGYVMAGVRSFDRMIPEETNRCNMEEAFLGMDGDINKDW